MSVIGPRAKKGVNIEPIRLTVTPRVTEDGNIVLTVDVENSSPGALVPGALGSATPAINTQQASTKILVPDGSTLVFGGVTVQSQTKSQAKVPFFGDIPLLGHRFKSSVITDNDKEFIFLITPRVLPG